MGRLCWQIPNLILMLQRGRAQSSADGPRGPRGAPHPHPRFNGAALSRARMGDLERKGLGSDRLLQRGRAQSSADGTSP